MTTAVAALTQILAVADRRIKIFSNFYSNNTDEKDIIWKFRAITSTHYLIVIHLPRDFCLDNAGQVCSMKQERRSALNKAETNR